MSSKEYLHKLFGLDGQVAVVTGGTGVLGGALAHGLARAGATVVVAGRGDDRGQARVAAIEAEGGKACYVPVDIKSRESFEKLLQAAVEKLGRVDILINGAGVNSASSYFEVR